MHFLIDANLPRSTADLLARYGHVSTNVKEVGLGRAKDVQIAQFARENRLCILTGDWDFGDIRVYPPQDHHGIVVIGVSNQAMPAEILDTLRVLMECPQVVEQLPGRLAIVEKNRIRLRPPP